jgi:hypothetical protein
MLTQEGLVCVSSSHRLDLSDELAHKQYTTNHQCLQGFCSSVRRAENGLHRVGSDL